MNNEELLRKIENPEEQESGEEQEETLSEESLSRYLVFRIERQSYALLAEEVQEISANHEIFYVPFVPPYVRGYANRHGRPYTVFDLMMLFEKEALEGEHLLILKRPGDQAAFLISDVEELLKVRDSEVYTLSAEDDTSRYFRGALKSGNHDIFILDPDAILERLERDIERS